MNKLLMLVLLSASCVAQQGLFIGPTSPAPAGVTTASGDRPLYWLDTGTGLLKVCNANPCVWDTVPTPPPSSTAMGGVKSGSCNGTDKVSSVGMDGTLGCTADQTGAGGGVAFREFTLVHAVAASTNVGATFVETVAPLSRSHVDLTGFTEIRVLFAMSTAATTGDMKLQYATTSNFASPVDILQVDNPTSTITLYESPWTAIPAGAGADVYLRTGFIAGNGTEDPAIRFLRVQVR